MAFKRPQIRQTKNDIQSLSIYVRSSRKFGKTTLFRDIIIEKFGDAEKGLLVGCGAEVGYNILDNLNACQIECWEDLEDLKEWLIDEKGKEHNIEMIAFDVVGEIIPMAEEQIIQNSIRDTGKACKSFNSAYGGYGEPRKQLLKLIKGYFSELIKAGFGVFAIAHTKFKKVKEKGDDTEGYDTLTSDLSNDCESIFGDVFDCVLTGVVDRVVVDGKIQSESRKLYLRSNSVIDAGCRFGKDTVPEYIEFNQGNMARIFIDTLEEGLRLSKTNAVSKEEFKALQQEERKELAEKQMNAQSNKVQTVSDADKQDLVAKLQQNIANLDAEKLKEIVTRHKVSFKDISTITNEAYNELKSVL